MTNTNTPPTTKRENVAKYLRRMMNKRGITDQQMASAMGYPHSRVIDMMTRGDMRIPISKVGPIAMTLGIEPAKFFEQVMNEYDQGLMDTLRSVFPGLMISAPQVRFLEQVKAIIDGAPASRIEFEGKSIVVLNAIN